MNAEHVLSWLNMEWLTIAHYWLVHIYSCHIITEWTSNKIRFSSVIDVLHQFCMEALNYMHMTYMQS